MAKKKKRVSALALITRVTARAKGGGKNTETFQRTKASSYRAGIQAALMEARSLVPITGLSNFFRDFQRLTALEEKRFLTQPITYDFLFYLHEPKRMSLHAELVWLGHRCSHFRKIILQFLEDREAVESLFAKGEAEAALQVLARHESSMGVSLWSMSLNIALRQWLGGQESQKAYLAEIKRALKKTMAPYLANFLSQRAEDGVSIGWYIENTTRRLNRVKSTDVMRFVAYKTLSELPSEDEHLAAVLRISQNHHEIDIYEAMIASLQSLSGSENKRHIGTLKTVIERLDGITDSRLEKLKRALGETTPGRLAIKVSSSFDEILRGNAIGAYRIARKESPRSIISTVVAAIALCGTDRKRIAAKALRARDLQQGMGLSLAAILSRTALVEGGGAGASDREKKFGYLFESLNIGKAFKHLVLSQSSRTHKELCAQLRLCGLNTEDVSILDVVGFSLNPNASRAFQSLMSSGPAADFAALFYSPEAGVDQTLLPDAENFARACGHMTTGSVNEAVVAAVSAQQSKNMAIASNSAMIALDSCVVSGDVSVAAQIIAEEVAVRGADPNALPISEVFHGMEWRDLVSSAKSMDLSIALFHYSQGGGDDKANTYRCFALSTFLESNGWTKPSEMRGSAANFERNRLIYFLMNACQPSILDMLPEIRSSREVLEERREICAMLLSMDPGNSSYQQEVLAISSELTVRRGLQTFDASRVHVDINALTAICSKEVNESFQRYATLLKSGVKVSETFDSVLRELSRKDINQKYLLAVPESEADELLISMTFQVRDRFLFDVHHGLDSYLSKRVRHGSIVGYIRSPAERDGIVTQQNGDGSYKKNSKWERQFEMGRHGELEREFNLFAKGLDAHLFRLKDVLLHVKSEQKPLGIFDVPINGPLFHLLRSVAANDVTASDFVRTVVALLMAGLNPSLGVARALLEKDTAKFVADSFESLRSGILLSLPPSAEKNEMAAAVLDSSANVQSAITTVASWFDPVTPENASYTMSEIVDIAVASVNATTRGFSPSIQVIDETEMTFTNLLVLLDVLFVAFGNVAKWSNVGDSPDVSFKSSINVAKTILSIVIENEVELVEDYELCVRQASEKLESLCEGGGNEMIPREGGSGLYKLAGIALQSQSGKINFGYRSPQRFFVEVDLSVVTDRAA